MKNTKHETLAILKYNDLKDGQFVYKLNGQICIGEIQEIRRTDAADSLPFIELSGYL